MIMSKKCHSRNKYTKINKTVKRQFLSHGFFFYLILSVLVLLNSRSQLHWSWGTPPELHEELYRVCGLQFGGAHSEMRCTSLVVLPLYFQCGSTFYRNNIWRVWLEDYICESVNFSPGAQEVGRLRKPSCYCPGKRDMHCASNELIFMVPFCLKICDLLILGKDNPWAERGISQLNPHLSHKQKVRMNLELPFWSILSGSVGFGGDPS